MFNFILIIISAALLLLSAPPFNLYFLIYFALVPFFLVCYKNRKIFNILIFVLLMSPSIIFFIFAFPTDISNKVLAFIAITFYYFILFYIFIFFFLKIPLTNPVSSILIAGVWAALSITSQFFLNIGPFFYLTQYNNHLILNIARVAGIYFISFTIIYFNHFIFKSIITKKVKYLELFCFICLLIILLFSNQYFNDQQPEKEIRVCLVQPDKKVKNINDKYNKEYNFYSLFNYQLFKDFEVDFIVYPELVTNNFVMKIPDYKEHLIALAQKTNAYLIIGLPDIDHRLNKYNSAFVISPSGKINQYRKNKLVPFLESHYKSNNINRIVETKHGRLDFIICWEALSLPKPSQADISFFLAKDRSLGVNYAMLAHSVFGVFLSIEGDTTTVVSSYTGPSLLINSHGQIEGSTPIAQPYIMEASVNLYPERLFYISFMKYIYFIILFASVYLVLRSENIISYLFPEVKIHHFIILFLVVMLIITANNAVIQKKIQEYFLLPEIVNTSFEINIPTYKIKDEKKECLKELLKYYGLFIEKYYSKNQYEDMSIKESLNNLGFDIEIKKKINIDHISVPFLVRTTSGHWAVLYENNQGKVLIKNFQDKKYRELKNYIDNDYDTILLVKPKS